MINTVQARGPDAMENMTIISHNLETVQDKRLVLITNKKSHMGFRLVPKLVTLNDLERRNGHYFALFAEFGSFSWPTDFLPRNVCKVKVHQQSTTDALCSSQ